KCYINEELCIVTSLNLYEFSQVNNNEMGILIRRSDDAELYRDAYEEAQRIIRISEEIRISMERIAANEEVNGSPPSQRDTDDTDAGDGGKLPTSKVARKNGAKTAEFLEKLVDAGLLEIR